MASIGAYIGHESEGSPAMVLYKKNNPNGLKGIIPLSDAWRYSEDHNPDFEKQIMDTVYAAAEVFEIGAGLYMSKKSLAKEMADIATTIENNLDDLLSAKPVEVDPGKVIGEGKVKINEETDLEFSYTDKGIVNAG